MNITEQDKLFIEEAYRLAKRNVQKGGWPFSTIIVRNGEVLSRAVNSVVWTHDPSDHAEIAAVRIATEKIGSNDLNGSTAYMLAPPCPMCSACMILAKISRIVYAVDVVSKDRALTNLPPTQGLYHAVSMQEDGPIKYEQCTQFSEDGFDLFSSWNSGLS